MRNINIELPFEVDDVVLLKTANQLIEVVVKEVKVILSANSTKFLFTCNNKQLKATYIDISLQDIQSLVRRG